MARFLFSVPCAGFLLLAVSCERPADDLSARSTQSTKAALTSAPATRPEKNVAIERYAALKADLESGGSTIDRAKIESDMRDALRRTGGVGPDAPPPDRAPAENLAKREALRARMGQYDMNNPRDVAAWAALKQAELSQ